MIYYTYLDLLTYVPDLTRYIKSKIKTIDWEDVLQETLLYLLIKFDDIVITNLKGLVINTGKNFVNKYFYKKSFEFLEELNEVNTKDAASYQKHDFFSSGFDTEKIGDTLLRNIKNAPESLLAPFRMQLEDYSIKEIALELNLNENTVKTRLNRCKTFLKQNIN